MNSIPTITERTDLKGQYVLVAIAADVPIEDGVVVNDFRLKQALPTLEYLVDEGARVIVMGHVGRDPESTMLPIFNVLKESFSVEWVGALTGDVVLKKRNELQDGQMLMLENTRSDSREKKNDTSLAHELASLADVFVNDDFPTAHREYVSMVGISDCLPSYAGITFAHEVKELNKARTPDSPAIFLLGGAKFETKQPLVEQFLDSYDYIFVGGALANDFFKAKGYEVGTSLISDVDLSDNSLINNPKVLLPVDVRVESERGVRVVAPHEVATDEAILDAGPATTEMLAVHIKDAKMVLWNGPFGNYEAGFDDETMATAVQIAKSDAHSVVGGGDTVAAIEKSGLTNEFSFLSTAGGAMLTFLEEGTLPAIIAITASH